MHEHEWKSGFTKEMFILEGFWEHHTMSEHFSLAKISSATSEICECRSAFTALHLCLCQFQALPSHPWGNSGTLNQNSCLGRDTVLTRAVHLTYGMFHVTYTTFKFNRNKLGTVSAYVMSSVLWSNQRVH